MATYYMSSDPANTAAMLRIAAGLGLVLTPLDPFDDPLPNTGVLICDWDHLAAAIRNQVLDLEVAPITVLAHSYDSNERHRLDEWGMDAFERIGPEIVIAAQKSLAAARRVA